MEKIDSNSPFEGITSHLLEAMIACANLALIDDMQRLNFQEGLLAISADLAKMHNAIIKAERQFLETIKNENKHQSSPED